MKLHGNEGLPGSLPGSQLYAYFKCAYTFCHFINEPFINQSKDGAAHGCSWFTCMACFLLILVPIAASNGNGDAN